MGSREDIGFGDPGQNHLFLSSAISSIEQVSYSYELYAKNINIDCQRIAQAVGSESASLITNTHR